MGKCCLPCLLPARFSCPIIPADDITIGCHGDAGSPGTGSGGDPGAQESFRRRMLCPNHPGRLTSHHSRDGGGITSGSPAGRPSPVAPTPSPQTGGDQFGADGCWCILGTRGTGVRARRAPQSHQQAAKGHLVPLYWGFKRHGPHLARRDGCVLGKHPGLSPLPT